MDLRVTIPDTPDLFVRAFGGRWLPAYRVASDLVAGAARTTVFVHDPDADRFEAVAPDRLARLAEAGRVLHPTPVFAVVDDDPPAPEGAPDDEGDPPKSLRLVDLDEDGASRWERMRRLLNARCGQLADHLGQPREYADDVRHTAAAYASDRRTSSSMRLVYSEMEEAVSYVEHLLHEEDFDLDAADEAYRQRRRAA